MIPEALKEIAQYESKIASLQKKVEAERKKSLASIHKTAGFASRAELIAALQALEGGKPKVKRGRKPSAKKATAKTAAKGAKKRAKRTRLTPELKEQIVAALKAGGKGAAVASKFGVSLPTVHNIKKAAGLTKTRKKK